MDTFKTIILSHGFKCYNGFVKLLHSFFMLFAFLDILYA